MNYILNTHYRLNTLILGCEKIFIYTKTLLNTHAFVHSQLAKLYVLKTFFKKNNFTILNILINLYFLISNDSVMF